jgi:hypothetical protein
VSIAEKLRKGHACTAIRMFAMFLLLIVVLLANATWHLCSKVDMLHVSRGVWECGDARHLLQGDPTSCEARRESGCIVGGLDMAVAWLADAFMMKGLTDSDQR